MLVNLISFVIHIYVIHHLTYLVFCQTVAKSPGQFKHVIKLLLAGDRDRRRWSDLVAEIALSYREQVLLDFDCFKDYVKNL